MATPLNDKSAAQFGSEGQKRTLALALKMAQAEYLTGILGVPPVLLIDDVMGELDVKRRSGLLPLLERAHHARGQVFMTCTEENWPRELGAELVLASGVNFVEQKAEAIAAIARAVERTRVPLPLAALHVMTTLTGSCVLALAVERRFLTAEAAWTAANVDEDFEMRAWGRDEEALARRERRWRDMEAAALLMAAVA